MRSVLTDIRIEFARLEAKLDTALAFRADLRREFEEHKRIVERQLYKLEEAVKETEVKFSAEFKEAAKDIRQLELTDTTHSGYFGSIMFLRDVAFAILIALVGAGVYFK